MKKISLLCLFRINYNVILENCSKNCSSRSVTVMNMSIVEGLSFVLFWSLEVGISTDFVHPVNRLLQSLDHRKIQMKEIDGVEKNLFLFNPPMNGLHHDCFLNLTSEFASSIVLSLLFNKSSKIIYWSFLFLISLHSSSTNLHLRLVLVEICSIVLRNDQWRSAVVSSHQWKKVFASRLTFVSHPEWEKCLGESDLSLRTAFLHRQTKKLLIFIGGSGEKCRQLKDFHLLSTHLQEIRRLTSSTSEQMKKISRRHRPSIPYLSKTSGDSRWWLGKLNSILFLLVYTWKIPLRSRACRRCCPLGLPVGEPRRAIYS